MGWVKTDRASHECADLAGQSEQGNANIRDGRDGSLEVPEELPKRLDYVVDILDGVVDLLDGDSEDAERA